MFSGDAIFSCVGSNVTLDGPAADADLTAGGERELVDPPVGRRRVDELRSGSAIGVAVVNCALPIYEWMSAGVNSHSRLPLPGSIASVRPYVVVNTITSRLRPPTVTPANSIAESPGAGEPDRPKPQAPDIASLMPVAAGPTRCGGRRS